MEEKSSRLWTLLEQIERYHRGICKQSIEEKQTLQWTKEGRKNISLQHNLKI